MAFQVKKPPINLNLSIEEYNKTLEFISRFEESEDSELKDKCKYIKEKLLKYSVPMVINDNENVSIRLFINEAKDILELLLKNIDIEFKTEYYTVLLKAREKYNVKK